MGSCFLCVLTGDALQRRSENSHFNFVRTKINTFFEPTNLLTRKMYFFVF